MELSPNLIICSSVLKAEQHEKEKVNQKHEEKNAIFPMDYNDGSKFMFMLVFNFFISKYLL